MRTISLGSLKLQENHLFFIGGPCVIESESHCLKVAKAIKEIASELRIPFVFKTSYDKANRLSYSSYRGPGLVKGLRILENVKRRLGIAILSDIHSTLEAKPVARVIDIIQIPAFLSRQTDLVMEAARTGRAINIKKGQFLAPWDMKNIVAKIERAGNRKILLTERGTTFGYNNLVSDMRAIPIMKCLGYPVVYDAGHSAQLPGGHGDHSGGQREVIPTLAYSACAAGCDGLFIEVHDRPDKAPSDGPNMLKLSDLHIILKKAKAIKSAASDSIK